MRITVVGAGYVGLVAGACFAELGYDVTCVDNDKCKIMSLTSGLIPVYEPGLEELVKANTACARLKFTTSLQDALKNTDAIFIAVGTPNRQEDGFADLSHIFAVAEEIGKTLSKYAIIVTKSTVPVGTSQKIAKIIRKVNPKLKFDVASNPEFLREGSAIKDFMYPDRIVVGAESKRVTDIMHALYRSFLLREIPMLFTNLATAELIKYASNAFLATKIAFINEIADLCERCSADIQAVSKGMGLDKRIGEQFLHAGPGYGGSCFPKDTLAITHIAQQLQSPLMIVEAVAESNKKRKKSIAERIVRAMKGDIKGKIITVLGVTFKANTGDMRESPSLDIIPVLQNQGAIIHIYDPQGQKEGQALLPNVQWFKDAYSAMENSDGIVVVTEWDEFRNLNITRIKRLLKTPLIIDLRNIYQPHEMQNEGFIYYSIGRSSNGIGQRMA